MLPGLEGKAALVTGGSRGIGKATAYALASEGCAVAICARGAEALDAAAAEIGDATGAKIIGIRADMTDPEAIVALVRDAAAGLGRLDILVNNAVNSTSDRASRIPDEVILNHITTKIMGYIRCARECIPHMAAAGGGRIINIGGMAARNSSPGNPGSGVTNSAMSNYSKALADDVASDGILVNCIHPGSTRTERYMGLVAERAARANTTPDAVLAQSVAEIPIGRMIEPQDIANLAAFLCSDLAAAITGQTIAVDGGGGKGVHF